MRGYIVILFALCTSLSAMYDGSKRLKVDNHIQDQYHPELLKLVDTSPTLKAFQADVGATAQEALEAVASHQEIQMVGAYARVKGNDALFRDSSSLFAKSWKKMQVSHLAQIANAANKLDIASCQEDMLALACQRVYASRFGTIKQLEHLVPDLYKEAGKRMSLDLLASMGFAVFADSSRSIPNWLEKDGVFARLVSRNLPFKTVIIDTTIDAVKDAEPSQDGKSVALAIETEPNVIETQLLELATEQRKTVAQFKIGSKKDDVYVSPNGKSCCVIDEMNNLSLYDVASCEKMLQQLPNDTPAIKIQTPHFSQDSTKLYISCLEKAGYDSDLEEEDIDEADYHYCESDDEGSRNDSTFSLFAVDIATKQSKKVLHDERYGSGPYNSCVSPTGRFWAMITGLTDKQSGKYHQSGNIIHLYDAKTQKKHVICGKESDYGEVFRCYNVTFTPDESKILLARDSDLYVIDSTQDLPETIIAEDHSAQIYPEQSFFDSLNSLVQSDLYVAERNDWRGTHYTYGLQRVREDALINLTECRTRNGGKKPYRRYLTHFTKDGTRLDVTDIRGVQDYLTTLENMSPEQVACVATLGAQYEQRNPAGTAVLAKVRLSQDLKQLFDTLPEGLRDRLADCIE